MLVARKEEVAGQAEVEAVKGAVDREGGGEAAGAAGDVARRGFGTAGLHVLDAGNGLHGAEKYAGAGALGFGGDVQHHGGAVGDVYVCVAGPEEERGVTGRAAAKCVAGRVVWQIGFGFDDSADGEAFGEAADDELADEEAGKGGSASGKNGAFNGAPGCNVDVHGRCRAGVGRPHFGVAEGAQAMIGVDWGTTSFRAYRLTRDGTIRDQKTAAKGIMAIKDGRFADALREEIGPWLAAGERHVLLSGMIGSRQGWAEAPYLACPAGAGEIAKALVEIPYEWGQLRVVPGLSAVDASGVPEVMRGEETQLAGVLVQVANGLAWACLPGTHSKWARLEGGRILGFTTHLTGETFAALRGHTILGRMMKDGTTLPEAFDAGVRRSGEQGGLLHHLFGVRALGLTGRLSEAGGASYLSGLLIGHEVRAALAEAAGAVVHIIGAPELTALYARAIETCGGLAERVNGEAAARGLASIGEHAAWN